MSATSAALASSGELMTRWRIRVPATHGEHRQPLPSLMRMTTRDWSTLERVVLMRSITEVGWNDWSAVATQLPRSATACENYARSALMRDANYAKYLLEHLSRNELREGGARTQDEPELCVSQDVRDDAARTWDAMNLCRAGWPVAKCGRWIAGAACGCAHISDANPYGEEWVVRDGASASNAPFMLKRRGVERAEENKLPTGWRAERRETVSFGSYYVYVGPRGEQTRTKKRARQVSGIDSAPDVCGACHGAHSAHTCGRRLWSRA